MSTNRKLYIMLLLTTRGKMMEVLKKCKKHGDLFKDDIQEEKAHWKESGTYLRCRKCRQEKDLKYKHSHRIEHIAYTKKWREENKEKYLDWLKQDRLKNPEKHREWQRKARDKKGKLRSLEESLRVRNFTIDQYNEMLEKQNHVCAICKEPETRKSRKEGDICRLMIDHCHNANRVRGLLCDKCNKMLGHARDSIEILEEGIRYLIAFYT